MNKSNSHVDSLRVISSEFILSYLFKELFYEWTQYRRFCCMSYNEFLKHLLETHQLFCPQHKTVGINNKK